MFEQMKTKSFALLLMCIVVTGIFVCMFGDPKPAFQDIVSKTHRQLSQLKQLKVNVPEVKEAGADELHGYLVSLGLTNPAPPRLNVSLPALVTAADSGQSQLALALLKSAHTFLPEYHLLIFDLGLDDDELLPVVKQCNQTNCTLRKFDYDKFPSHIGNTKFCAYRPIIIQKVLTEFGAVLWLDVQFQFITSKIEPLLAQARKVGLVSWAIDEPTSALTHPRMYDYFGTQQDNYFFQRMAQPSHVILYNTERIHRELMLPWLQCVLTLECIAPIGAQSSGCRFDKKPYYRYSGCHRYDMSALNVALGKIFDFKADSYVASKEKAFFRKTEFLEVNPSNYNQTSYS